MYGNGVKSDGMKMTTMHHLTELLGKAAREIKKIAACFVAGLGISTITSAASLIATGTTRISGTTILVFVYPGTNPFFSYPVTLFSLTA